MTCRRFSPCSALPTFFRKRTGMPDDLQEDIWAYEKIASANGFSRVAGVDEAGRGPLAGPVVSAAVILPENFETSGLADSKALSPKKRDMFFERILSRAVAVGVGVVEPEEIDRVNILQAALLSMAVAVRNLGVRPDCLLIDGKFIIPQTALTCKIEQQAIVKGDCLSISISAASVVAKVTRDRIMEKYHCEYPCYGFDRHKGYPTKAHREAIRTHGCCPIHRKTFKGVKEYA